VTEAVSTTRTITTAKRRTYRLRNKSSGQVNNLSAHSAHALVQRGRGSCRKNFGTPAENNRESSRPLLPTPVKVPAWPALFLHVRRVSTTEGVEFPKSRYSGRCCDLDAWHLSAERPICLEREQAPGTSGVQSEHDRLKGIKRSGRLPVLPPGRYTDPGTERSGQRISPQRGTLLPVPSTSKVQYTD
jgi:hypothetical protein